MIFVLPGSEFWQSVKHPRRALPKSTTGCYYFDMISSGKFLGIDYGTKRIGIAISDENARLAFPREVFKANGELFPKLVKIFQKEKIKEIVVGESLDFAGLPNLIQKEIDFFIAKLEKKFKIPVHREKEFLTSIEARRYQEEQMDPDSRFWPGSNRSRSIRKTNIAKIHYGVDSSAAALILQRYLDKKNKRDKENTR